jgi:hypothetical protein
MVNGDLLALADDLNDFSESEDEDVEPAATRETHGPSDTVIDPRVGTVDEGPEFPDQPLSSKAAEAELAEMAMSDQSALEAANHSAAQTVASLNMKKHDNAEAILFDTARGRAETGEDLGGVDLRVSPPGNSPETANDAHDDGESSVPSAAPVKQKFDTLTPDAGVSNWRPTPDQVRGFDEVTAIGAMTEFGVAAVEPPAENAGASTFRPEVDDHPHALMPEFATEILSADGGGVLNPDLGTGDRPFYDWTFPSARQHYFFSGTENFNSRFTGARVQLVGLPRCPPARNSRKSALQARP